MTTERDLDRALLRQCEEAEMIYELPWNPHEEEIEFLAQQDYKFNPGSWLTDEEREDWSNRFLEDSDFPTEGYFPTEVPELDLHSRLGGLAGKLMREDEIALEGRVLVLAPKVFKKEELEKYLEISGRIKIQRDGSRTIIKEEIPTNYQSITLSKIRFYIGIDHNTGVSVHTRSEGGFGEEGEQDIPYVKVPIVGGWPQPCEARVYLNK